MIPFKDLLPPIPEVERTPTVRLLLTIIEQLQESNQQLQERVEVLETEIARLKKLPKKPKIRPSTLPKDDDDSDDSGQGGKDDSSGGSSKPRKRKKTLIIHKHKTIKPDNLPVGSKLMGYQNYTVQDLLIQPYNTQYRLARYRTPDGEILVGKLPAHLQGSHFGTTLKSYILYQHHCQRVTQPLIGRQLAELGFEISSGQISNMLIEEKEFFHTEKDALLTAGINNSAYIHVDDTGSRHDGKSGYCTHIGKASAPSSRPLPTSM